MMNSFGLTALIPLVVWGLLLIVPFFQLWKRTGHSGWMSLLMLLPIVNLVMLYVLAFKRWPALETSPNVEKHFE